MTDDGDAINRIAKGLLYTETDCAFLADGRHTNLLYEYNFTSPVNQQRRVAILKRMLGGVGARPNIASPFHVAYGGNIYIGDDFFANTNLALIDDVDIRIGDGVLIAPSVTVSTTGHPVHPELRYDFNRFSEPITIHDRVWIGSNVVVLPGVTIGYGSVIGAGSVVSHSIPSMVVALGVPARVSRPITDEDLHERES